MPHKVARLVTALFVWGALLIFAQSPNAPAPPPSPAPRPQFFAGIVTALDDQHITVSRSLVGRAPESRTFIINADTTLNRTALKVKSRVTVRYLRKPEGDVALEIQIRHSKPS
jgi:hypothetical protein